MVQDQIKKTLRQRAKKIYIHKRFLGLFFFAIVFDYL